MLLSKKVSTFFFIKKNRLCIEISILMICYFSHPLPSPSCKDMRWQGVYSILFLLVGGYDVVRASIDCGNDIVVALDDANYNDGCVWLQNGNTDRCDVLLE